MKPFCSIPGRVLDTLYKWTGSSWELLPEKIPVAGMNQAIMAVPTNLLANCN